MKLKTYLKGVAVAMLAMMCSCTSDKEKVTEFLTTFATAVDKGDRTTIAKCYPAAAEADSLVFSFDPATLKVEPDGSDSAFHVTISPEVNMTVIKKNDDSWEITESHGIFAWSEATKRFALGTGWIQKDMNDADISKQLADTAFVEYVSTEFMKYLKKKFIITNDYLTEIMVSNRYQDAHLVEVKNNCDYDIAGSDYVIVLTSTNHRNRVTRKAGKDIYAGSDEEFTFLNIENVFPTEFESDPFYVEDNVKASIKYTISDVELLGKYFNPKGDEYQNYISSKK